jgi:glycosyltransferase involved in cell wall biosynthesis
MNNTNSSLPKVLLDLSILKHPYCGLGQIALNYVRFISTADMSVLPFRMVLLVPKKFYGCCGDKVDYVPRGSVFRHFPWLYPKVEIWHAMHQLSSYRPYSRDTKYLLTIHDFNFEYEKTSRKLERDRRSMQRKIDRADCITCISHFTESELSRWMRRPENTPVQVIYNGVEWAAAGSPDRCPAGVDTGKPFFFSIGEIKEKKNFMAAVRMMEFFPDYNLYIAGKDSTPYADEIRSYVRSNRLSNVFLLGIVEDAERQWLYSHCEAFLFPSLFEGFGLPVIEAMSFGKPVFSSAATSLAEIGAGHACFWTDFAPEAMAEVVKGNLPRLLQDESLREKRIEYAHTFSYEKHMQQYFELYARLLGK